MAALVLLASGWAAGGIPQGPPLLSGGGGVTPDAPNARRLHHSAATPVDRLFAPLYVAVSGPLVSYTVVVTGPTGGVVAVGTTDAQGLVQLTVPALLGLELTVMDTSVIGLPVSAGQAIAITVP